MINCFFYHFEQKNAHFMQILFILIILLLQSLKERFVYMKEFTKIIEKFVNKMGYLKNEHLEGIVWYGSSQTGFANDCSDIDLHIVFSYAKNEIRGSDFIDNYRIEYFEKTLSSLYQKVDYEFHHQSNAMVSMFVYGTVLLDKHENIKKLQEYIKAVYSSPMPPLNEEYIKEQIAIINNFFDDLIYYIEVNDLYANHVFHLTLERIKDLYFAMNALPGVSRTKALKTMLNDNYRNATKKENPEPEFIDLYIRCLNKNISLLQRLDLLQFLYQITIQNISFNKNVHRIILKK